MLMLRFFLILCLISLSLSYRLITRKQQNTMKLDSMHSIQSNEISNLISKSSTLVSLSLSVLTVANKAIAAETKPPSAAETKEAIIIIKQALDDTKKMASLASEKKYTEIAALFDTPTYKKFEDACSTLTRSDQLSQEDRKSLGTIKRYGVVADAIIMLGGIKGELKQGNVNVADSGGSLQKQSKMMKKMKMKIKLLSRLITQKYNDL